MKHTALLLICIAWLTNAFSQDYLSVPSYNPALLEQESTLKLSAQFDSLIYNFDTLSLPFVDDFSENHLPKSANQLDLSLANEPVKLLVPPET